PVSEITFSNVSPDRTTHGADTPTGRTDAGKNLATLLRGGLFRFVGLEQPVHAQLQILAESLDEAVDLGRPKAKSLSQHAPRVLQHPRARALNAAHHRGALHP